MFEEIDARAYKNLRGDIKALISDMIYKMHLENEKTELFIDRKWYEAAEHHNGYAAALDDISSRLMDIIDAIDSERDEEITAEDEKITECLESEITADFARSKQL